MTAAIDTDRDEFPAGSGPRQVHIHYLRPPDRKEIFHQWLLHEDDDVKVSYARDLGFEPPVEIEGEPVLEKGSDAVWLTFPGRWHDIGRFHTADDTFRGFYANVLTPPTFHEDDVWRTTDLFLDVWLPADGGEPSVLDQDQLAEAVRKGWVVKDQAARAEEEARTILERISAGEWPPPVALEWTLERAREAMAGGRPGS